MVEWRNGGAEEQHKRCQAQEGRKGPPRSVKGELCQAGSECIEEEEKNKGGKQPSPIGVHSDPHAGNNQCSETGFSTIKT
jgi:hypothetical protein